MDADETDERAGTNKDIRQLNFKPRLMNQSAKDSFYKGPTEQWPKKGLSLKSQHSAKSEEAGVIPHVNFFLEKKRKHEEELSMLTVSTHNSDKNNSYYMREPQSCKVVP
jgi:hypothetical protein